MLTKEENGKPEILEVGVLE